jgi:hypothetical protein
MLSIDFVIASRVPSKFTAAREIRVTVGRLSTDRV